MILTNLVQKLRNIFQTNSQETGAVQVGTSLEEKVLKLVENMPTLPDTATRAMSLANDPESQMPEFSRLIEGDATIATAILRIANSAIFAGGMPAVKLQQAVVRLGMKECQNLIISIGMRSLFRRLKGGTRLQCEILWHHAYVTASLCRQINRAFRLGFDGEEFSGGLLHDLGRILLALADPDCFARAGSMDFLENEDVLARERGTIGIDHCALGSWFGEHSKLPAPLIQAMRYHHEPELAERSKGLVALVATCDHIANHLQLQETIESYDVSGNFGLAVLWENWPEAKKDRLYDQLPDMMEESLRAADAERVGC